MTIGQPEVIQSQIIGEDSIELTVAEATNAKNEVFKYVYQLFVNGTVRLGFCSQDLSEYNVENLLNKLS